MADGEGKRQVVDVHNMHLVNVHNIYTNICMNCISFCHVFDTFTTCPGSLLSLPEVRVL